MNFSNAARELDVDEATVRAVAEVESNGKGFLSSGEPKILFERHVFYKRLKAKGINPDLAPPDICSPSAGGYKGGIEEHARLKRAVLIDRDAALESASWTAFQIMGYHWRLMGYARLQDFINDAYKSEEEHLMMFVRFIKANEAMHAALVNKHWSTFARLYNGPAYAKNNYDVKLEKAYKTYV